MDKNVKDERSKMGTADEPIIDEHGNTIRLTHAAPGYEYIPVPVGTLTFPGDHIPDNPPERKPYKTDRILKRRILVNRLYKEGKTVKDILDDDEFKIRLNGKNDQWSRSTVDRDIKYIKLHQEEFKK